MERLVTSFRIPDPLYQRWRALSRKQNFSLRDRIIKWIAADLKAAGVDLPPQEARTGWWQSFPEVNPAALTAARENAGLSQSSLAKAIGVYPSTVSRYESVATRYVPLEHVTAIAAELGVEPPSLLKSKK